MTQPTSYNAFSGAPPAYGSQQDGRQKVVDALMQQAGSTAPSQSPWQGVSRGMAGLAAGLFSNPNWSLNNLMGTPPKPAPVVSGTGGLY